MSGRTDAEQLCDLLGKVESIACGLSSVGELLRRIENDELGEFTVSGIGHLLDSLADSLLQLSDDGRNLSGRLRAVPVPPEPAAAATVPAAASASPPRDVPTMGFVPMPPPTAPGPAT